ncbi:phosphoglycerate mutase family protein [Paracoccidioides lutzii Pb01]|uniref:Phosphoglycerate mutase family protein n=1 Tax=Paracoccidioides lutzii (strain ATCC MYA-826 / Pb01) TaxID=502779 RepID=C1GNG8_PARBA|nr:phosphoglycerate mutase family protein [Paracoccidioides lutzii Pb01]EEH35740.2 phosphoglycerate mutase family protein [Paracoccidioides lutzii Pb01]
MRLFLIRHAESEHNVAQVYAGTTDSALTNHGMVQIQRLALHFEEQGIEFTTVFSSDLLRARITAEGICSLVGGEQQSRVGTQTSPVILPLLREKDFGCLEGKSWLAMRGGDGKSGTETMAGDPESQASIASRVDMFLTNHLLPVLYGMGHTTQSVAVVSHGVLLSALWEALSRLFLSTHVILGPNVEVGRRISSWSNTGYLELAVGRLVEDKSSNPAPAMVDGQGNRKDASNKTQMVDNAPTPALSGYAMTVLTINGKQHLHNLRRTPGVGRSKHDASQKRIDSFFQRPKN